MRVGAAEALDASVFVGAVHSRNKDTPTFGAYPVVSNIRGSQMMR